MHRSLSALLNKPKQEPLTAAHCYSFLLHSPNREWTSFVGQQVQKVATTWEVPCSAQAGEEAELIVTSANGQ